jgi:hypothetical protein
MKQVCCSIKISIVTVVLGGLSYPSVSETNFVSVMGILIEHPALPGVCFLEPFFVAVS